jgi:hypothetical protein
LAAVDILALCAFPVRADTLFDTEGPNPSGIQVELSGTVNTLAAVPGPGTLTLADMGLAGLIGYGWRRGRLASDKYRFLAEMVR